MEAGRRLRFAAVLVVVVLALTGFQSGKSSGGSGGKSRSGKSSSGGGCSSSKKKNHDYDDDALGDEAGYDSGGSGAYDSGPKPTVTSSTAPVTVTVVDCVKPSQKKRKGRPARKADTTASVRITSTAAATRTFRLELEFQDAGGMEWDETTKAVTLEPGQTLTVDVPMSSPSMVDKVRRCEITGVGVQ
ncbi:hypothetical protein [Streptomyces tritici]|uniref:hypothetical protein n=1 Tax=Streptomyces tritici TaxID=2054410 RepID=UPI003AF0D410